MNDMRMTGGPELLSFIGAFPRRLQNGAVRAGMVAGARVVRDEARSLAPKKTGKLAKAIRTGSPRVNKDGTVSISISLRNRGKAANVHAFLGVIWEGGSRAYSGEFIRARRRTTKRHGVKGTGKFVLGKNFFGMFPDVAAHAAHPFMAPALEGKASEAINAIGSRVREYLSSKAGFTAPVTIEVEN